MGLIAAVTVESQLVFDIEWPHAPRVQAQPMAGLHVGDAAMGRGAASYIQDRWWGSPALFSAASLPDGTEIRYFDVSGLTQSDLIASLNAAKLCSHYDCLVDPGDPPGGETWGLEGDGFDFPPQLCYSPATTNLPFVSWILIPRWQPKPYGVVATSLMVKWNDLERIIYTHEATHAAIGVRNLKALQDQAHRQPSCQAEDRFLHRPDLLAQEEADQLAYHTQLRDHCVITQGCLPYGFEGWHA